MGELDNNAKPIHEVAIIGAGPIGIELAVVLKEQGVQALHFDSKQIGYTISWWPRNTYFFSTTERIEIAGVPASTTDQQRLTGEQYLAYLRSIVEQFDLAINTYEPVVNIERIEPGFRLTTQPLAGEMKYIAKRIVIAFGDMHTARMLGIPGEQLPHVSHYLHDPHDYFRKRLLVVGGRNSAVESALRCWRAGARVAISYRRRNFREKIVKQSLLPDLLTQIETGNIQFFPHTHPVEITPESVTLERLHPDGSIHPNSEQTTFSHPVDFVLLNTGFVQDSTLFEKAGVNLIGEGKTPEHNPETMETNVPGLFVAGTAAAGTQKRFRLFIENSHEHVGKIVAKITGKWPAKLGTIASRKYELPLEDFQDN